MITDAHTRQKELGERSMPQKQKKKTAVNMIRWNIVHCQFCNDTLTGTQAQ